jgi:hypothetical protein
MRSESVETFGIDKRACIITSVGGIVAALALFSLSSLLAPEALDTWGRVWRCIVVAAAVPSWAIISAAVRIEVGDSEIRKVFLGRWTVARKPRRAVEAIRYGDGFATLTLRFRDGSTIRMLMMSLAEYERLRVLLGV